MYGSTLAVAEFHQNSNYHRTAHTSSQSAILRREAAIPPTTLGGAPIESFVGDWFALRGWTGREKALVRELGARGIPYYLPLRPVKKTCGAKKYRTLEALYPSYTFICADPEDNHRAIFDAADAARWIKQDNPRIVPCVRGDGFKKCLTNMQRVIEVIETDIELVASEFRDGAKVGYRQGHKLYGVEGYIKRNANSTKLQLEVIGWAHAPQWEIEDPDDLELIG